MAPNSANLLAQALFAASSMNDATSIHHWPLILQIALVFSGAVIANRLLRTFQLWMQAMLAHAYVSYLSILFMPWRRTDPRVVVQARITARRAGITIPTPVLEAVFLAGGHLPQVVDAVVLARAAGIPLTFESASAIDLAGTDLLGVVQTAIATRLVDPAWVRANAAPGLGITYPPLPAQLGLPAICVIPPKAP